MNPLLFLLLIPVCMSLKDSGSVTLTASQPGQALTKPFGFDIGATATIDIYPDSSQFNSNVSVVFRTALTFTSYTSVLPDCRTDDDLLLGTLSESPLHITWESTDQSLFYLVVLQCNQAPATAATTHLSYEYAFVNPGGSQLSLGQQYLPTFYKYFSSLWIILFLAQAFLYFLRQVKALHVLLTFLVATKLAYSLLTAVAWHSALVAGIQGAGFVFSSNAVYALSEGLFFVTLLGVARGWCIASTYPNVQFNGIIGILALILGLLLFFSFYDEEYYFLGLVILYFFMMPKVFAGLTTNVTALQYVSDVLRRRGGRDAAAIAELQPKIDFFNRLRIFSVGYLVYILALSTSELFLSWTVTWVVSVLQEVVSLLLMAWLVAVLRPRARLFVEVHLPPLQDIDLSEAAPRDTSFWEANVQLVQFPRRPGTQNYAHGLALARFKLEAEPSD